MKYLLNYSIFFILSICNLSAQSVTWSCKGASNIGVYTADLPTLGYAQLVAEGGQAGFEASYDSYSRTYLYTFVPLEQNDYIIKYKEFFLWWETYSTDIEYINVYKTNLVLNAPRTESSYIARATTLITLSPGFSVSASTTNFTTLLVHCNGSRMAAPDPSHITNSPIHDDQGDNFAFYPNPISDGILKFVINEKYLPATIKVFDATSNSYQMEKTVDTRIGEIILPDNYKPGIYILSFTSSNGKIFRQKLLIN